MYCSKCGSEIEENVQFCPKCGTNLNLATCDCEQGELDPRMAQFQDVFNKFKEV